MGKVVRVRASLEDPNDGKVASAETLATLEGSPLAPASTAVTLEMDGRQISASEVDGPYRLLSVTLMSAASDPLDVHAFAVTTQAYQASDFAAGPDSWVYLPLVLAGR